MKKSILLAIGLIMATSPGAVANKLPPTAAPLTSDEIKAMFSDHTAVFNASARAFFAADGSIKGINHDNPFEGTWKITGNEICMTNHGIDKKTKKWSDKFASDCWKLIKAASVNWTLYTKAWDGRKVDLVNGWYKDTSLKAGDLVSDKYSTLLPK